jgi:hypothetical protein
VGKSKKVKSPSKPKRRFGIEYALIKGDVQVGGSGPHKHTKKSKPKYKGRWLDEV